VESDRLNQWLTLGANIAVLLGLIFLIIEIDQNNDMMRAQTRSDISDSIIDNIKLGMDPRVISAYRKQDDGQATHYQYRNGLFDDAEFEADLEVWREEMQAPELELHWSSRRHTYSEAFRRQIDELME
jgi:hypothetical protein